MPDPEQPRILVVDDEPTLRLGFRLALATEGYEVEEAGDGEQALTQLGEKGHALMILDLRMPGLDGIGVLKELAASGTTIPTIVASAQINDKVALEALQLGVVDILPKPVRPNELRKAARTILREESAYRKDSAAPLGRARCLLRRRRPAEALATFKAAAEPDESTRPWMQIAECLSRPGDPDPDTIPLDKLNHWRTAS